jgi:hypothetical protein
MGACGCPVANQCSAGCTNLMDDAANCGTCGNACPGAEACVQGTCTCTGKTCSSVCVDIDSDPQNCGGCGVQCPGGDACNVRGFMTPTDGGVLFVSCACCSSWSNNQCIQMCGL